MHEKSTRDLNPKEPSLITKSSIESIEKYTHEKDATSSARETDLSTDQSVDETLEQDKRVGKRKRTDEKKHCIRKRRGPSCPKKLNTVSQWVLSASASLSPKIQPVLPSHMIEDKIQLVDTNGTQSCSVTTEINARLLKLTREKEELVRKNGLLEKQLAHRNVLHNTTHAKLLQVEKSLSRCRDKLIEVLRYNAVMQRKLREEKLESDNRLIGRIVQRQSSVGTHVDVWENGEKFKDLQVERQRQKEEMEGLVQKKKDLYQLKKKLRKQAGPAITPFPFRDGQFTQPRPVESVFLQGETHFSVQAEVYSLQVQNIKRKQSEFEQKFKELKLAKHQHVKFIKMMNSEKKSLYQGKLLNNRYLCTGLIGRGGFSEVWKGYDLESHKYVACKIHALNEKWTDRKKENFTRHATREAHIQKGLCHPRIVQLYDVFGIDGNTFCTVLELCEGTDLDAYLKANAPLTEREARSIITQLFEGLKYLTQQKQPIIHYDLKPGNILHIAGEIKITDFGLSKILQKDQFEMELTSQGAGTYWYLPPECFLRTQDPPMIGTGVDVWSGGCVLYEMLYGQRPFGHNMSQEKIMREGTLLQAQEVNFPVTPKVSDEAKDLIQKCLARNHKDRPDPLTILDTHPFFSKLRPART